jgi:hypothetical protein
VNRDSSPVKLHNRHSGCLVDAILYEGISADNLQEYNDVWAPKFLEALERARELLRQGKSVDHPVEDKHWDWSKKVLKTQGSLAHKHYVIECEDKTQGMMQLEMSLHRSRIESGQHMVYIDYLSVAPWNRKTIETNPRFKLVGTVLLGQAIGTSDDEGFFGRIGLHSLPSAADWYRNIIGMKSFGMDSMYENLEYFEMSKSDAQKFLNKTTTV